MRTPDCADLTPDGRIHWHAPDEDCLSEDRLRYFDRGTRESPEAFRARVEREAAACRPSK